MLFHSSIRKELARSFGATLVVLVTVVMTMTLIRTLGEASRGTFDPADVLIIMGYTVLSDMPTILSMSLFIAVLSVLTRMFRDSEMVIWFGSGQGLASLLVPLYRFAWPILVVIMALAFFILPWAFGRIEDFRDKYEKRGDIARIEPGKFQESANGDRVFFIEKDSVAQQVGHNVFIATNEQGKETITSAQRGKIEVVGDDKYLVLENGQRLEKNFAKRDMAVSTFETYGARVGPSDQSQRTNEPSASLSTLRLLQMPTPRYLGELAWRAGLTLAAFNFIVIGLATAGVNPRVGRTGNLGVAFLTFIVYFNLLILGKNWVETSQVSIGVLLLTLHGGTLLVAVLWLSKRHNNWTLRLTRRPRRANPEQTTA
ncbi:LPS export ABC transporter permease LptF [Rhodoferax aquaticus]|uniref:Lipopolysaccharide export system permease protein LptF n=1 Tax=Rhodoferax aquaticus TaxID=2527691 RepID=A0A515EP25_9BURK|nr:LPS export ABC transporter permease LptF [Rhodoferax aquaticus]QDL54375.1 LPS export ABC transporter permease LptF [Rhodoferax aquaticus]